MRHIHPVSPALLMSLLLCHAGLGSAQDLKGISDPTRPPASLIAKRAGASASEPAMSASAAEAASAAVAAAAASAAAARAINLAAIRYDVGRSEGLALINGEWVHVGDKVHGMSVMSITQDAVLLSGAKGVRRLKLFEEPEDLSKPARTARRGRKEKK